MLRVIVGLMVQVFMCDGAVAGSSTALAMAGGGFRALTSNAALTAGLLGFVGRQQKLDKPTLNNTGLHQRFDLFSTVSGSSWYLSELLYSQRFNALLEDMALKPEQAFYLWLLGWLDPFKSAVRVDPTSFDLKRDLAILVCTALLGKADEDTIFTFQYVWSTNNTWNEFVQIILKSTAGISHNMNLDAPVGAWAQGKDWLIDHTAVLPSRWLPGVLFEDINKKHTLNGVKYTSQGNGSIPEMIPAAFSVKLGAGYASPPYRYIAPGAVPDHLIFKYNSANLPKHEVHSEPVGADLSGGALSDVSQIPIWGAASASSAFAGSAPVLPLAGDLEALSGGDLTPWVSSARGESFTMGTELVKNLSKSGVNPKNMEALASNAVHGVIDGAYSDNTGIGQAVAAGASEVVTLLTQCSLSQIDVLSTDGPPPPSPGTPRILYPLFKTRASTVSEASRSFEQLKVAPGSLFLTNISFGTFPMVTTENQFFGIEAGRNVTVHVVQMCSTLNIGFFEKYSNYAHLSQDIIMTINHPDNEYLVKNRLLPMFLGSKVTKAQSTPAIMI